MNTYKAEVVHKFTKVKEEIVVRAKSISDAIKKLENMNYKTIKVQSYKE